MVVNIPLGISVEVKNTHFVLMFPFRIGVVITLLLFSGWLSTERGTVIRAGSLPWRGRGTEGEWERKKTTFDIKDRRKRE